MFPEDRTPPLSNNSRRMLAQVGLLIDLLEARLKDLDTLEKNKGKRTEETRRSIRSRVRACYTVRLGLIRGRFKADTDLDKLVTRIQISLEHRRFLGKPAIQADEIQQCDMDALCDQLQN